MRVDAAGALIPRYEHIFLVMLENHGYGEIIGNPDAPRINSLARGYGLATDYYAVTHPSEPNYVAIIGGSYFGIQDDAPYTQHTINAPSLASELEAAGLRWKSYQQSLPAGGYTGTAYPTGSAALYASKHDPFLNFTGVQHRPAELGKIVPDTQLATDLRRGVAPSFGFIVPDQCHDMHGTASCTDSASLIRQADAYVSGVVGEITGSSLWRQGNDAIVITWDEDDYSTAPPTGCCGANPGGGHVATIVIANHGPRGARDGAPYNHYSLLRTIEDAFGLGCLQHSCDAARVRPMTPLFTDRR